MSAVITDPMERLIADALDDAGIGYETGLGGGNPSCLDFRLENGVEIEVKRFHSPRVGEQMARADNVIVAQGKEAVEFFALLISAMGRIERFGYESSGHGFTCARMASNALGKPGRRSDLPLPKPRR